MDTLYFGVSLRICLSLMMRLLGQWTSLIHDLPTHVNKRWFIVNPWEDILVVLVILLIHGYIFNDFLLRGQQG